MRKHAMKWFQTFLKRIGGVRNINVALTGVDRYIQVFLSMMLNKIDNEFKICAPSINYWFVSSFNCLNILTKLANGTCRFVIHMYYISTCTCFNQCIYQTALKKQISNTCRLISNCHIKFTVYNLVIIAIIGIFWIVSFSTTLVYRVLHGNVSICIANHWKFPIHVHHADVIMRRLHNRQYSAYTHYLM